MLPHEGRGVAKRSAKGQVSGPSPCTHTHTHVRMHAHSPQPTPLGISMIGFTRAVGMAMVT